MLKFLAGAGFALAPRPILEREVDRIPLPATDAEIEKWPPVIRHLKASDLETIVRIDQRITGQDRAPYFRRKFDEVLHESAIAVSLVAENDGFPVAFAMARVDFGDFGHVEPSAALDTLGVDPPFAHQGFGRALLEQMVENLAALHVERLETEVERDNFALLRFLFAFGFGPSQRLSFERPLPRP
jgi:ribosomal protein S18 acetylase RimI-like enzyme